MKIINTVKYILNKGEENSPVLLKILCFVPFVSSLHDKGILRSNLFFSVKWTKTLCLEDMSLS